MSPGFKDSFSPVKVAMKMSPEPNKGKVKKLKKKLRQMHDENPFEGEFD